ncbi:MAG: AbrB/MazE/SpoVT family DNA-binding domain-containing protein [Gemmatimonadetes bacterium]|nr:AbrB/MazE/SpoVT family DNA-binding domain-containing protein [Gemmatimonadota bacterium]
MAIFRVKYYSTISVGSGGRITIPQDMRDDLRIDDGDSLTVRLEEADGGERQITVWKSNGDGPV